MLLVAGLVALIVTRQLWSLYAVLRRRAPRHSVWLFRWR